MTAPHPTPEQRARDAVFSDDVGFASCGHCGGHSDLHGIVDKVAAAIREAEAAAYERAAKVAQDFEESYWSQMEGQGEPEFGQLEFAAQASAHISIRIRALAAREGSGT